RQESDTCGFRPNICRSHLYAGGCRCRARVKMVRKTVIMKPAMGNRLKNISSRKGYQETRRAAPKAAGILKATSWKNCKPQWKSKKGTKSTPLQSNGH